MVSQDLPRVSHYGTIRIGDLSFDCAVLDDQEHTRVYIQNQLNNALSVSFGRGSQGRGFLAKFAPKYLENFNKSDVVNKAKMPSGGYSNVYQAGILSEIVTNVIDAALDGALHHKQAHILSACRAINKALAVTGEVALIDEATGYQYHREPDALQDLFGRLIREKVSDWERRFHPDYYAALFRLFGWEYKGQAQRPAIIGQITDQIVYGAVFPGAIMAEVRDRRGDRFEKLHQWLKEGGISLLEKQIAAVTMIARSSTDYQDFKNRCLIAFHSIGQIGFVFPAQENAA